MSERDKRNKQRFDKDRADRLSQRGRRYWRQIHNLKDSEERRLFAASRPVYENLFEPEYREPFRNFRDYISAKPQPSRRKAPQDFYYVCVLGDEVVGMLFFTVYPRWLFIAYAGVDTVLLEELKKGALRGILAAGMFGVIGEHMRSAGCEAALFELEQIGVKDIDLLFDMDSLLKGRKVKGGRVLNRIATTALFQELGAWKIPGVRYRQPDPGTEPGSAEVPMHLMYLPPDWQELPPILDKKTVREIVHFVYLTFYKDGFDESEDYIRGNREATIQYLKQLERLSLEPLKGVNQCELEKISLQWMRNPVGLFRKLLAKMKPQLERLGEHAPNIAKALEVMLRLADLVLRILDRH